MFKTNSKITFDDNLFTLKDMDENKINDAFKIDDKTMIHNSIGQLKDFCNFNCGNSNIILVLNILNNDAYDNVSFSTINLLDGLSHMYFFSEQTETDKKEYYDNITRYFRINVL